MRGPNWSDPSRGVTGEPKVTSDKASYETYTDENGMTRTRIIRDNEENA